MLSRLRHLRISLAAKCQLLFGAAVVMIIAATLFVPWRRMDELTNQLNDRAAYTLAQSAKMQHVAAEYRRIQEGPEIAQPATQPTVLPVNAPATEPSVNPVAVAVATTQPWNELLDYQPPRLAGPRLDNANLTKFERRAIRHFIDTPVSNVYFQISPTATGESRYLYARRLTAEHSCIACHSAAPSGIAPSEPSTRESATTTSATRPSIDPAFLGIVSVDILSLVDESQVRLNRLFIFLAGLLAGSLAIAVFYLITTRIILQPVRVLQETAEKVSQGDLNIRSDINTGDEFQQLAETFNTMLANMKKSTDQLQTLNKNLDLKLGQLAESNVALYESNRLKSEFLANVSHELRTPLNSILGFADLLREALAAANAAGADSKPARYVQNIQTSGRNLLDLINDLLDLAKIEAGRMEIRGEPLSLGDLFEGLVGVLKPLSENKQLSIVSSVATDVPIIQTDPAKVQQVLYNLLSNAIKFSPVGGRVDLSATRENDTSIRITVCDQGPGIEPAMQEIIFEKFRQIDAGHTRQHGGTGLGLSIARELTMLLGGAIGVKSLVGQGAEFSVVLPLKIQPESKDVRAKLLLS